MSENGKQLELTAEERKCLKDRFGIDLQDDASLQALSEQFELVGLPDHY